MVQYHKTVTTKRSGSGARKRTTRNKRLCHKGGFFAKTKVSADEKEKRTPFRTRGAGSKVSADVVAWANVSDKGVVKKVRVKDVVSSTANRHYTREDIITKGTIIETEAGKAKVTSRPGQDGVVNAVLVKE